MVLILSVAASAQKGFSYYKDASKVGSANAKAFAYFQKAYYDHIWKWSLTGADSAEYYLKLALQEDSSYAAAYAFLGHVYQFKTYNQVDVARKLALQKQYAEKAVSFQPQSGDAYSLLSDVRWHEGDTLQAFSLLHKAIDLEPDHVGNYIWLAVRFSQMPRGKDSAIYYLHRLLALDPAYGQAYMKLGNVYAMDGQWDSARFYYGKAIGHFNEVKPKDNRMLVGYNGLAQILLLEKKYDSALYYYSRYFIELVKSDYIIKDRELPVIQNRLYACYAGLLETASSLYVQYKFTTEASNTSRLLVPVVMLSLSNGLQGFIPWATTASILPFRIVGHVQLLYQIIRLSELGRLGRANSRY